MAHKMIRMRQAMGFALGAALAPLMGASAFAQPLPVAFEWATVANNGDKLPGSDRKFNSYNQPSVSERGVVAFRARSKGGQGVGEPLRGIYLRDMGARTPGSLTKVFDTLMQVPAPNNTLYQGQLGTFTEFPAFPRIAMKNSTVATRAQSRPLWTYTLPDGTESRVGTSGIYVNLGGRARTAAAQLGALPDFSYFAVPGAPAGTRYDQFPGAPAITDRDAVVFKGNYTVGGMSKTGVFFREFGRVGSPVNLIANSDMLIPGQPAGGTPFGSTAPPSASSRQAVFLGLDNEEAPTLGGIYLAELTSTPRLRALVSIGGQVPDELAGTGFTRLGEALSFDGRFVAFWGSWGSLPGDFQTVTLICPVDGQAAIIAYCKANEPEGGYTVEIPLHQGFFVHDVATGRTRTVVKTGSDYSDFLYWVFSGRPPGVGDAEAEDPEAPRWRSSAFASAFGQGSARVQAAFKGRKTQPSTTDGIYLTVVSDSAQTIRPLVETGMPATLLDPLAPAGAKITTVGLEREALRNQWLAITASMLDSVTSESWAGVYVARTR